MDKTLTIKSFYEVQNEVLKLSWIANHNCGERNFTKNTNNLKAGTVGYFNLIHSNQVQIVGRIEMEYLTPLTKETREQAYSKLFSSGTLLIITADGYEPLEEMITQAEKNNIALFKSPLSGEQLVDNVHYFLAQLLADKITLHGVFMEVLSIGVLLTGTSGIGKSELALELITHGHRLIADDAPHFARIAPDIIIGTSPIVIQDFLEVRGIGVLNIRKMYGDSAIKASKYLKLIINLRYVSGDLDANRDRLLNPQTKKDVLGMKIPISTIPVAPGRNLAVLVEAAVRNHLLCLNNYFADADIGNRQKSFMQNS